MTRKLNLSDQADGAVLVHSTEPVVIPWFGPKEGEPGTRTNCHRIEGLLYPEGVDDHGRYIWSRNPLVKLTSHHNDPKDYERKFGMRHVVPAIWCWNIPGDKLALGPLQPVAPRKIALD